jgi:hypothetical protein
MFDELYGPVPANAALCMVRKDTSIPYTNNSVFSSVYNYTLQDALISFSSYAIYRYPINVRWSSSNPDIAYFSNPNSNITALVCNNTTGGDIYVTLTLEYQGYEPYSIAVKILKK